MSRWEKRLDGGGDPEDADDADRYSPEYLASLIIQRRRADDRELVGRIRRPSCT